MASGRLCAKIAPQKMIILSIVWVSIILVTTYFSMNYDFTPGSTAHPPIHWPKNSMIPHHANQPTLLVFVHPYCPCSEATLQTLKALLSKHQKRYLQTVIVFFKPGTDQAQWKTSKLWKEARSIPGAILFPEQHGQEIERFGIQTSGQILLYNNKDQLRFQGGITLSRGHIGDNAGRRKLQKLIMNYHGKGTSAPVFGCPLWEKNKHGKTRT